jgi:hypothetical protein
VLPEFPTDPTLGVVLVAVLDAVDGLVAAALSAEPFSIPDCFDEIHLGVETRDRLGTETLEGEPQAQRQLPSSDREGTDPSPYRDLVEHPEHDRSRRGNEHRGSDQTGEGDRPGHQSDPMYACQTKRTPATAAKSPLNRERILKGAD